MKHHLLTCGAGHPKWCLSRHPGLVVGCWSRARPGGRYLEALLGVVGCLNQPIWPTAVDG